MGGAFLNNCLLFPFLKLHLLTGLFISTILCLHYRDLFTSSTGEMLKLSSGSVFFRSLLGKLRLTISLRKTATYSRAIYSFCFILARNCSSGLSPGHSILKDLLHQLTKRVSKQNTCRSSANTMIPTVFFRV